MLAEAGRAPDDPRAAEEFYLRTSAEPALDVNGIAGGSPVLQKTVLPVLAEANLSIRLAPGQDVEAIAAAVERLLREAAPAGAELELDALSSARARPRAARRAGDAARPGRVRAGDRARRPLLVRSGGTLPIVPALVDKGIPTIITGFALPESNIHSPNERLLAEYVPLGHRGAALRSWQLYSAPPRRRPRATSTPLDGAARPASQRVPEAAHLSMIGSSASPFSVSSYSTRGGDSA